jgi:hypothetical protein
VALKQTKKQSCNTSDETIFERVISLFNLEYIIEMFVYTTDSYRIVLDEQEVLKEIGQN